MALTATWSDGADVLMKIFFSFEGCKKAQNKTAKTGSLTRTCTRVLFDRVLGSFFTVLKNEGGTVERAPHFTSKTSKRWIDRIEIVVFQ
jgi:hypothetical protein